MRQQLILLSASKIQQCCKLHSLASITSCFPSVASFIVAGIFIIHLHSQLPSSIIIGQRRINANTQEELKIRGIVKVEQHEPSSSSVQQPSNKTNASIQNNNLEPIIFNQTGNRPAVMTHQMVYPINDATTWTSSIKAHEDKYGHQGTDATWRPIHGARKKSFTFSAYLDDRKEVEEPSIRVIAVIHKKGSKNGLYCHFYHQMDDRSPFATVKATIEQFTREGDASYYDVMLECKINNQSQAIAAVSVVSNEASAVHHQAGFGNNKLIVNRIPPEEAVSGPKTIAFCTKSMNRNFHDVVQLVEFIEMHSIMVESSLFLFYVESASRRVDCVLHHYQNSSKNSSQGPSSIPHGHDGRRVILLKWQLPYSWIESPETAPLAATNDCFYRSLSMGAKFVANYDLDEIFVPTEKHFLIDVLEEFMKANPKVGTFNLGIRRLFPLNFQDDQEMVLLKSQQSSDQHYLPYRVMRKTAMDNRTFMNSKQIVVGRRVIGLTSHWVHKYLKDYHSVPVPSEMGRLHHYRLIPSDIAHEVYSKRLVKEDGAIVPVRTTWKYLESLDNRIVGQLASLLSRCNVTAYTWIRDQDYLDSCFVWTYHTGFLCKQEFQ